MSSRTSEPPLRRPEQLIVARVSELTGAIRASRRELGIAGVVVTWIAAGVWLDSHASIWPQRALGVVTWIVLLLILRGERRDVRAQGRDRDPGRDGPSSTSSSGSAGVYTFIRLAQHSVVRAAGARPPLPHGAGARALRVFVLPRRPVIGATIAVGGAPALRGLVLSRPRNDVFPAHRVHLCLAAVFLLVGPGTARLRVCSSSAAIPSSW